MPRPAGCLLGPVGRAEPALRERSSRLSHKTGKFRARGKNRRRAQAVGPGAATAHPILSAKTASMQAFTPKFRESSGQFWGNFRRRSSQVKALLLGRQGAAGWCPSEGVDGAASTRCASGGGAAPALTRFRSRRSCCRPRLRCHCHWLARRNASSRPRDPRPPCDGKSRPTFRPAAVHV